MKPAVRPPAPATLLVAAISAACSASPSTPADASVDVTPDVASPRDATTVDVVTADAPTADAPVARDGGACEDFTGGYTLTGTCSVPGFAPFPTACIAQTGCAARVLLDTGAVNGEVVGNRLTFQTSITSIPLVCTVTREAGAVTVHCDAAGGAATCDAEAVTPTFPGATRWCCAAGAQDCASGARCNLVGVGASNTTSTTACVPAGALAEGATCTREGGRLGADQCAAGLTCVNSGQPAATQRICQRMCTTTAECRAGETCLIISSVPRGGVCRPSCTVLGSDCGGATCRYALGAPAGSDPTAALVSFPTCQPVGTATEGQACPGGSTDCAADLTCARRNGNEAFACRRICDSAHACPTGMTCSGEASATNPLAGGACLP